MSKIKINLTEAIEPENSGGSLYISESGDYVVRIDSFKEGKSENKGTPFLEFTFKTDKGQIFSQRFYTIPNSLWKLKKLVQCVFEEETSIKDVAFDPETLLDKWVELNIVEGDYIYTDKNGNEKHRLEIYDMRSADKPTDSNIENLRDKVGDVDESKNDPW